MELIALLNSTSGMAFLLHHDMVNKECEVFKSTQSKLQYLLEMH